MELGKNGKMKKSKESKQKKKNQFSSINLKNPFHWWGLIVVIIGVTIGGAIGGGVGGICGITILNLGNKPDVSTTKKVTYSILITIGGVVGYVLLASIFLSFLG